MSTWRRISPKAPPFMRRAILFHSRCPEAAARSMSCVAVFNCSSLRFSFFKKSETSSFSLLTIFASAIVVIVIHYIVP